MPGQSREVHVPRWAAYRVWVSASVAKSQLTSGVMFDGSPLPTFPLNSYPITVYGKFQRVVATAALDEAINILIDTPAEQEAGQ